VLVVEAANLSLERDRGVKKSLYARGGIQEYCIVDVDADCIEH
jgi:Uma2 family endonuclease